MKAKLLITALVTGTAFASSSPSKNDDDTTYSNTVDTNIISITTNTRKSDSTAMDSTQMPTDTTKMQ